MKWSRTNYFPLKFPSPKLRVEIKQKWSKMFRVAARRWCWTSKGRHNFLLQHETREMGPVGTVVSQIRGWIIIIINPNIHLIVFFQVQRRLEGQRTILRNGDVILCNTTRPDYIPVQNKIRSKINIRWRFKIRHSREREKINSRSRRREYSRCQIHGISLVHPCKIERNRSCIIVKWRISLDVEMDRRRFDVDESDQFLETF